MVLGESAPQTIKQNVALDTVAEPTPIKESPAPSVNATAEEEDDTMSYFAKLAQED